MNIVLIDDDEEDVTLFIEAMRELSGEYKCSSFNSTAEALVFLNLESTNAPEYIFIDAHMYPIGGKETLSLLRENLKLSSCKCIIHSGSISVLDSTEFKTLGAHSIIIKGRTFEQLCVRLREAMPSKETCKAEPN